MIGWLAAIWAVNEMHPAGCEGTALAMATTASNAAQTLSTYLKNVIGGLFCLNSYDYFLSEDPEVQNRTQRQMTYDLVICSIINLSALLFLWLLPKNKEQARLRFNTWGTSLAFGVVGLIIIAFAVLYGAITDLATLFCPCEPAWGGSGCLPGTCITDVNATDASGNTR